MDSYFMYITLVTLADRQPRHLRETDGILDRDIRASSATTRVTFYEYSIDP